MNGKKEKHLGTHLNVRQSIAFLVLRLIVIQVATALVILFLFFPVPFVDFVVVPIKQIFSYETTVFGLVILGEISLSFFVTLQWLNEYYEIFPTKIIHKKGFFFRREDDYAFEQIKSIKLHQGLLGKLFNFGTISVFDRFLNKYFYLYLIHNPHKCFHVLETFIPETEEEKKKIRERILSDEEGEEA